MNKKMVFFSFPKQWSPKAVFWDWRRTGKESVCGGLVAGLEGTEQGRVRRASPEGSSGSPITSKDLMQQQKKYTENLGSKASLSKKRIRTMETERIRMKPLVRVTAVNSCSIYTDRQRNKCKCKCMCTHTNIYLLCPLKKFKSNDTLAAMSTSQTQTLVSNHH